MSLRSETPPPPADHAITPPPDSAKPTTAMLKADIDSGRTGDKVNHYDPGLSQLGTDDEAAGYPPSPERVALARMTEAASPRVRSKADVHGGGAKVRLAYLGLIVAIAVVLVLALWLGR